MPAEPDITTCISSPSNLSEIFCRYPAAFSAINDICLSYAEKIKKGELTFDERDSAQRLVAKVKASSSAHPARAEVANRMLAVEQARVVDDDAGVSFCEELQPGQAKFAAKRLFLGASDGAVELLRVKPDGKKSMDARSFAGGIQGIKTMQLTWGRA